MNNTKYCITHRRSVFTANEELSNNQILYTIDGVSAYRALALSTYGPSLTNFTLESRKSLLFMERDFR